MSERRRDLVRFIIFTYLFIAVGVFKYNHEGETDMDILRNFDSVIFFQKTVIEKEQGDGK